MIYFFLFITFHASPITKGSSEKGIIRTQSLSPSGNVSNRSLSPGIYTTISVRSSDTPTP